MGRGRPLEVEWEEDAEELESLYRQERNPHRRTRLHALWLLRTGTSMGEVSHLVSVSYRTIQRWVGWYRAGGLQEVLGRIPGHGTPGGKSYLSIEQQTAVKAQADSGAFRTAQEAVQWIEEQWGVCYKYNGIYGLFRRLDLRKKVPRPQSEKANPEAQVAWKRGG